MFICANSVFSQSEQKSSEKEDMKQLKKEKRKAEKKAEEDSIKQVVTYMVENRRFVLEADYLSGRSGARVVVNSTLNFIMVDSAKSVIQLGSNTGMGYNGVGGITVDGTISRYELKKTENKHGCTYTITLFVNTDIGTYDIVLWISQNGNANATIRGTTSGQLSYAGNIVPLEEARVYKAHSYP